MRDVECPYCGADVEINHDDGYGYEESELHQQECWKCGKTFAFTTEISIDHEAYKADCLNDGEHQYEKTATYPPEFARLKCKTCGDETPLTANVSDEGPPVGGPSRSTGSAANETEKGK